MKRKFKALINLNKNDVIIKKNTILTNNNSPPYYSPVCGDKYDLDWHFVETNPEIFEEIIEPKTPRNIFEETCKDLCYEDKEDIECQEEFIDSYHEKLEEAGYEIVKKAQVKSKPAKDERVDEREELAKKLSDVFSVGAEWGKTISFEELGEYTRKGYLAEADMILKYYVKKENVRKVFDHASEYPFTDFRQFKKLFFDLLEI